MNNNIRKNNFLTQNIKEKLFLASLLIVPFICFCVFYVYVNFSSFTMAFKEYDVNNNASWVGFDNFAELFRGFKDNSQIWLSLKNSLKFWWLSFLISNPLYFILSYYIFKKFIGHRVFRVIVMIPQIVSAMVFALVYKRFVEFGLPEFMESIGITDFPKLIYDTKYAFGNNIFFSIWLSFGTSVIVYVNGMSGIDKEILESASIDGVNDFREFWNIILPLIWPSFTTMVVTGATGMFTASGALMTFYMYSADPAIWGLGYYFTVTVKTSDGSYMSYPDVATSGLFVMLITLPVVFLIKWLMQKADRTESAV